MRLEALPFEVDFFEERCGRERSAEAFFLTHAHADHLHGLSQDDSGLVYCTRDTACVLEVQGFHASRFRHLEIGRPTRVLSVQDELVAVVTALPANHCIGACMFLFDGPFGRMLHTGDFRYGDTVVEALRPLRGTVDTLLLDSTFCNPSIQFPPQSAALLGVIGYAAQAMEEGVDVFIGGDRLGKEELYAAVSRACGNCPVYVDELRFNIIQATDAVSSKSIFRIPRNMKSGSRNLLGLRSRPAVSGAIVCVAPWWAITRRALSQWTRRTSRKAVGIIPTACPKRFPRSSELVHVAYSSHSNFSELRTVVALLKPRIVAATPETSHYTAQDGISRDPAFWFSDLVRPEAPDRDSSYSRSLDRAISKQCPDEGPANLFQNDRLACAEERTVKCLDVESSEETEWDLQHLSKRKRKAEDVSGSATLLDDGTRALVTRLLEPVTAVRTPSRTLRHCRRERKS